MGSVGVSFNNFSIRDVFTREGWDPIPAGNGQRLSLRFQSTGIGYQSINASFTEPWLGGKRPNALTVAGFSSRQFVNIADGDSLDRLLYIVGGSVGLGRRLRFPDDNFVLQNELSYQYYDLRNWSADFLLRDGVVNNFSFKTTLSRYSLDQPIYPRTGSNISLSLQITPPYSLMNERDYSDVTAQEKYRWAEYHKWRLKAEWFTPIVGNLVLRTSAKMGLIGFYNPDIGYSPLERFELGGAGISNFNLYGKEIISLRGYKEGQVTTSSAGDPFFAKYTVELRYPLSLNPSSTIYGLAFLEGGNSWPAVEQFNPFDVYRSAGVGLRVFLPMFGTLGFDYGVGFDHLPNYKATSFGDFLNQRGQFNVVLGFEPE